VVVAASVAAALGLIVVAALGYGRLGRRGARDASPATTAATPERTAAVETAPPTVSVMLWTRPAEVEVWQGERRIGTSSAPLQLPRGTERLELRLKKDGFLDATVSVTPDHDQGVDATLSPPPPKTSATTVTPVARPPVGSGTGKMDRILGGRD
jgi:hypothetical protein